MCFQEHAQTRYYCFAVATSAPVGVAMANVFTLYLFYEVIMVFTTLVAHHQDEEVHHGARKSGPPHGHLQAFLLPAMILTYVLAAH
jgi:multicomponent Na+:H+ antiporter subunit D